MEPTYADGDRLLVLRSRPRTGVPVVFEVPSRGGPPSAPPDVDWLVKRVVATEGQPVPPGLEQWGSTVPPGHFLVRGDNPRSLDSRHFGFVPEESALGRVLRAYRPAASTSAPDQGSGSNLGARFDREP
ncbi:MAG: S26 family signal peptidase [Hamadaea sp.]|nr:S26 family signal peptidase [Hamadaea sp.]NUR51473.1 S26 family signal peptidase [Hamadaea sp.]NUT05999.1 S26 family signal peptidase [Hamadaea sp.]